ncbi:MAG: helix-turn-helix domain-containing protein [Thermoplasmatota archaeon]
MHRVTFTIEHRGCWATEASRQFPDVSFVLRESAPIGGHARDILCVRAADPAEVSKVHEFFQDHPAIRSVELLDSVKSTAFFMVEGGQEESIIEAVTRHRGFRLEFPYAERGHETWSVGLATREKASAMLADIGKLGELKVQSIVHDTFPDLRLSDAQRRVIRAAIERGYYDVPRRTSPTELATELGLAKSTLLEHLNKAEARLILGQRGWI